MTKSLSIVLLALCLSFATQAQNQNPLFPHIPPGSVSAFQINLSSVLTKAGWSDLFDKFPKPTGEGAEFVDLLKDPSLAGIDISKDIVSASSPKTGADSVSWTTIVVYLSDSSKFSSTLRKVFKDFKRPPVPAAIKAGFTGQTGSTLTEGFAWNDKIVVITHFEHSKNISAKPSVDRNVANLRAQTTRRSIESFKGYQNTYFTNDALFQKVFNDGGDAHLMIPQGEGLGTALKKMKKGGGNPFAKAIGLNDSKTLSTIRFENGLISLRSLMESGPKQTELYNKILNRPLNTDLIARLPAGDLLGVITIHFDPKGLIEVVDQMKSRGKLDSSLAKLGLSTADVTNAFTGDFVVAGIQPSGGGQPTFYFATSVADPVSFLKLTSKIGLIKDPANASPTGEINLGKMKLAYAFKDNILVLSMSADAANAYFASTEKRSTAFLSERIKNSIFGLYLDVDKLHALLQNILGASNKPNDQKLLTVLSSFENVSLNFGSLSEGNFETYLELKLTNKQDNSLRTLINMIPSVK